MDESVIMCVLTPFINNNYPHPPPPHLSLYARPPLQGSLTAFLKGESHEIWTGYYNVFSLFDSERHIVPDTSGVQKKHVLYGPQVQSYFLKGDQV